MYRALFFNASAGIPSGSAAFTLCNVRIALLTTSSVGVLQLTSSGFSAGKMFAMLLGGRLLSTRGGGGGVISDSKLLDGEGRPKTLFLAKSLKF